MAIVVFLAPNAFLTPISLVLSVTETSIIFIKAIEDPKIVMIPINQAERPKYWVISRILLIKSSLLEMPKLSSSMGFNLRTFLMAMIALSTAWVNNSFLSIITLVL